MSEVTAKGIVTPSGLAGDSAAAGQGGGRLEQLYRQYWWELCKHINAKFGPGPPDPEDVAQAAFTKLATLDNPHKINNPKAFLCRVADNIVLDHFRKDKVVSTYIDDVLFRARGAQLEEITPERVLLGKDQCQALSVALKKLPKKQQVVLALKHYHGATFAQIAERTGWSVGDISRQLAMATQALTEAVEKEKGLSRQTGREKTL